MLSGKSLLADPDATLADVSEIFSDSTNISGWRKLCLVLLLIVDGVLIASHQIHRPTKKYIEMLQDIDSFLSFPWGRESFLHTISLMRHGKNIPGKCDDPITTFCQQLEQKTIRFQGFPLVLQLFAFQSVPRLLTKIPNASCTQTLLETPYAGFPNLTALTLNDVFDVESDPKVCVICSVYLFSFALN